MGKAKKGSKNISDAVREICLWLPEAEEVMSHGSPDFRVAGKNFATYVINHHGDGHLALWLRSPPGAQSMPGTRDPHPPPGGRPFAHTRAHVSALNLNPSLPDSPSTPPNRSAYGREEKFVKMVSANHSPVWRRVKRRNEFFGNAELWAWRA